MGVQLFDDDSDSNDETPKIEPNLEFARRYEHNKKREDLQRLEELKNKGLVSDSEDDESETDSDDESEESKFMSSKHDLKFYDALLKIKNRDPSIINQKDKNLFEESDDNDESSNNNNNKKKKKKKKSKENYLKDVNAAAVLEGFCDDEEEGNEVKKSKSYGDEQEEIRRAVLEAGEDDSDGDLLIEKKRDGGDEEEEEDEVKVVVKKLRNEYHGEDEELDENERFLKEYLGKQMWKAKNDERRGFDEMLSEDEEEVEKADEFEATYNHRFEEGVGDRILGHSRFTEGSVRKKSSARKLQRKNKEERMAQAEFERKEELKRLKNLKKKEIEEKLEKIRAIAGIAGDGACAIDEDDLEEEFDPEEYDKKMKQTFDEDYYDEEDVDPGFGSDGEDLEKPDFDKEDELLGLPKDWDVAGSADGFAAAREKILKQKEEEKDSDDIEEDVEEELPGESKRKRKRKIPLREKLALDEVLEEYYKLDYEDTIGGDIKTRFKYASVPSQRYGLNKEEILMMDEKELNQYVPLKKLAPYREKEWKLPNSKRYALKMKSKSLGKEVDLKGNNRVMKDKHKGDHISPIETSSVKEEKSQLDEPNGEVTMSRRAKRRRRQADLKLSHSRLLAYGITKK